MLQLRDIAKRSLMGEPDKIATALAGFDNSYRFDKQIVLENFPATNLYHLLQTIVKHELEKHKSIRLFVQYHVIFSKLVIMEELTNKEIAEPYINAKSRRVLLGTDLLSLSDEIHQEIWKKIEEFAQLGSGWKFEMIKGILFHTMKYNVLRGSSYVDLPPKIKSKRCCINIKNVDNKCFQWAVLSALFPAEKHADRVEKYISHVSRLNFKDINFPVAENQIPKFEKQNNISINIFGLDEKEDVYPRYISEKA